MKKIILIILILSCYTILHAEIKVDNTNSEIQNSIIKDGMKIEYYSNGNIFTRIPIDNGTGYSYYKSGKLWGVGQFINGVPHGIIKEYYENGVIKTQAKYLNGKRDGLYYEYYENGNIKTTCSYTNDNIEGIKKQYKEDGKTLIYETNYKHGKKHGLEYSFYDNGAVKKETEYINGEESGNAKIYYESGILRANYIFDKKSKITTAYLYNNSGKLSAKSHLLYGILKEGKSYLYDDNGTVGLELLYKNDELISGKCGNGRKLNNAEIKNFENGFPINCGY